MKLTSFSVSNFRSITTAKKVPLSDYSILVGANNEGKSNILNALAIAMGALVEFKKSLRRDSLGRVLVTPASLILRRVDYDWKRDFPVSKQNSSSKNKDTAITLEFLLREDEREDFEKIIGSKIDGKLPITMSFSDSSFELSIAKPGRGSVTLNKKAIRIAEFVSERINFEYIPAIRTAESAASIVADMISEELAKLEQNSDYAEALSTIESIQQPILDDLAESVRSTVSRFLPSVNKVDFSIKRFDRNRAFSRSTTIEIDDGNITLLERKGDGVKSLVALALMRHASEKASTAETTIIALEEPEAHLHPRAIHELRSVIASLSERNQVVLTSHSPLFVDPSHLESTIIVQANKAACAKDIGEVRDVLGVRLSDNLQSARLVAILEGEDDQIVVPTLLSEINPKIKSAISSGDLVFDNMGGATNMQYKVRLYKSSACMVQCLLDNDEAGLLSVQKSLSDGTVKEADYNLLFAAGMKEAELEDFFDPNIYKDAFFLEFGVDSKTNPRGCDGKKWSHVMGVRFKLAGKTWSNQDKMRAKAWLANYAKSMGRKILIENRSQPLVSFADTIVRKLGM